MRDDRFVIKTHRPAGLEEKVERSVGVSGVEEFSALGLSIVSRSVGCCGLGDGRGFGRRRIGGRHGRLLHVFLMELLGIGFKLLVEETVDEAGRIGDAELRDVDEEFAVQGATTDEDREIIAAAVSESITDADFLTFDDCRNSDKVTDGFMASGVADVANFEIIGRKALAGVEWAFGGKKREFKTIIRSEADVASPN